MSSSSKAPGPSKKQNRRKQSEANSKPQQRQQQTKECASVQSFRSNVAVDRNNAFNMTIPDGNANIV
jgi:hypothetical protein